MSPVSAQDLLAAVQAVRGFVPDWAVLFTHDGEPQPKERPRSMVIKGTSKIRTYTPEATRIAEDALAWSWKAALRGKTLTCSLALACVFYRSTLRVVDDDNLEKLVKDAGNKARVWKDDSQVLVSVKSIELDRKHPRTEIALMPTVTSFVRDGFAQTGLDLA